MEERTIDVGGIELALAEAGRGQRPVLLLHGFTGAKEDFTPWLDRLAAAGWHAVAPDLRGHGASTKPTDEDAYSFEILADDALGLVDALGWDRCTLLGHSMGGMVAQVVAARAGRSLDGLVLMDTSHGPIEGLDPVLVEAAVGIVRAQGVGALAELLAGGGPLETPSHRRLVAEQPEYAAFLDRKFRATAPALYAAMAPAFVALDDRLGQLATLPASLPVLVLVGAEDQPFLAPSRRMASAVARGSLTVIPEAGHCPQFENPDAWWAALSAFLDGLMRAAAHDPAG